MADSLSDAFPPVSKQEWVDKIVSDLKGKPYEKMVRTSESGVPVAPVYMASDLPADIAATFPGRDDHRRGHSETMGIGKGGWITAMDYSGLDLEGLEEIKSHFVGDTSVNARGLRLILNAGLRNALSGGASGSGLALDNWAELAQLVEWANANGILLYIEAGDAALDFLDSGFLGRISGALDLNPMLWDGKNGPNDEAIALCARAAQGLGGKRDLHLFQLGLKELELAGANAVQQIAFSLAMASDLVDRLGQNAVDPRTVFDLTTVHFPVSTDFFEEIGKFRAFRILWNKLQSAWGIAAADRSTYLIASSALSAETIADAHVNLLRHTTQAMAAAIGGCNVISIASHDAAKGGYDPEAVRLARNIQLMLKHESDFGKLIDPAGGAYFVEDMTEKLADRAWKMFQDIEAVGGWCTWVAAGQLDPALASSRSRRLQAVRNGSRPILGTNLFANEKEKLVPAAKPKAKAITDSAIYQRTRRLAAALGITGIGLAEQRLSEEYESLRQQAAAADPLRMRAFLLTFGDPVMRSARATFARNVLAAGGFTCFENPHPESLAAAVANAEVLGPTVIVLCAADADYFNAGSEWINALRAVAPEASFILAGKPEGWEALQAQGIVEPIYAGMDRVAFLQKWVAQAAGKEAQA